MHFHTKGKNVIEVKGNTGNCRQVCEREKSCFQNHQRKNTHPHKKKAKVKIEKTINQNHFSAMEMDIVLIE